MAGKLPTIDEYLAGVRDDQRAVLERLREIIGHMAPGAEECISYQLPAFRLDGKVLVGFGATANHCAFYPMSSSIVEAFKDELQDYETSNGGTVSFGPATPILRMFDESKAREFYLDFLGFQVDWEHRFEPGLPLYMQISKDSCVLHLSEHHGDSSPGAAVRIATGDLDAFQAELAAKRYRYARPEIEEMPWGTRDMSVRDPSGNRLTFTHVAGLEG